MGENLTKAIQDVKNKHNYANLVEEQTFLEVLDDTIKGIESGGTPVDTTNYYTRTETDSKFITQTDGANAIADLATKAELASATDSSTNLMVLDPSTSAQGTLDSTLANIYDAPAVRQATLSNEQMKQMEGNILAELLKKMAK